MTRQRSIWSVGSLFGRTSPVLVSLALSCLSCDLSVTENLPSTRPNVVVHAPTIKAVSGSGIDELITVSGTNFGSHSLEVEWTGGRDGMIEAVPANTEMRDIMSSWTNTLGDWNEGLSSAVTRPHISTERVHSHNKAIKCWVDHLNYDYGGSGVNSGFDYRHSRTFNEIYVTWWVYFDPGAVNASGHGGTKTFRISDGLEPSLRSNDHPGSFYFGNGYSIEPPTGAIQRAIDLEGSNSRCWGNDYDEKGYSYDPSDSTIVCANNWWCFPNGVWEEIFAETGPNDMRAWARWEVYARRSDLDVRNGSLQISLSVPGQQSATLLDWDRNICTHRDLTRDNPQAFPTPESWIYAVWQNYYGSGGGNGGLQADWFIDDIYLQFDTGKARVELGDAAVWGDCQHREIQPCVTWSNDSIRIKLNAGSFSAGNEVYLFVVNRGGTISSGFPVILR